MTEEEWLHEVEDAFPREMLDALAQQFPPRPATNKNKRKRERKLRLFGCAACRHIEHLFILEETRHLLEIIERHADGLASGAQLGAALRASRHDRPPQPPTGEPWTPIYGAYDYACRAADSLGSANYVRFAEFFLEEIYGASVNDPANPEEEHVYQKALLLDIFGNPFRAVAFDPAWRTDTAIALARQMYDSREFGAMPILADALQDAGCEDEQVLNHCRDATAPHVRGCWVCDLVLSLG